MNETLLDTTRAVRVGEELDLATLATYLAAHLPLFTPGSLSVEQFPGGHSNLTYLIRSGNREWVLRKPPFGTKIKTAHDMGREFRMLSVLKKAYTKIPQPIVYCEDDSITGAPFYVMERKQGVILRARMEKNFSFSAELMRSLSEALVDNLAELHTIDYIAAGFGDFGKPAGYVERQVKGWTERYFNAQTDDIKEVEEVTRWLAGNMPQEYGASIIHNDYKYDNLVLNPSDLTKIEAVLDWEMATIGDPLMDLGTSLGYWIDADDPPEMLMLRQQFGGITALPGNLNRREIVARYAEKSRRNVPDMLFYYVFALFKVAVIAQQIYHRYKNGFSKDERFSAMLFGVKILTRMGSIALDKGRIDRLNAR